MCRGSRKSSVFNQPVEVSKKRDRNWVNTLVLEASSRMAARESPAGRRIVIAASDDC
jgi:hypothetical protein